jgi:hypothetical protein
MSYYKNKSETLINFLTYLEKEYKNAKIIGKKKTLLTDEIINSIKTHYSDN